jgi:uncharacterized protein with ParB-like and HNH nuclease domain
MRSNRAWIVTELIAKENRQFKIPVYQRSYDWKPSQCKKLYEDIINSVSKGLDNHFTGTIVYLNTLNFSTHSEEIVIDGQQRITTVLILLKALYDKAKSSDGEAEIVESITPYIRNRNTEYTSKLIPVNEDKHDFDSLMSDNFHNISHGSNFYQNYVAFSRLIDESLNLGISLRQILEGVRKLLVVEIVLNEADGDNPQAIFESINSTGLDLTLSDKIRNFILMTQKDQDRLFAEYWVPIQETIGKDNLSDFFITYLNMNSTENIKLENTYEKFKKYFQENNYSNESILIELKHYSQLYKVLISDSPSYSNEINKYTSDIRLLNQTTLYPFLLRVLNDHSLNRLNDHELAKILRFFVVYSLRRIVIGVPSNTLRSLYKTLYKRVFIDSRKYDHYYDSIVEFFIRIKNRDALPTEEEFRQQLMIDKLYQKRNVCKYILNTIENEDFNEKVDVTNLTIEHVMPQSLPPHWREYLGPEADMLRDKYLHTIGNLTITGYNSELSTKPFDEKKSMIKERSKMVVLNEDILSASKWDESTINKRSERLVNLTIELFSIDLPILEDIEIESNDQTATLIDYSKFHKSQAKGYYFSGVYKPVVDFNDLLRSIVEDLYEIDSELLEKIAEDQLRLFDSESIVISKNDSILKDSIEIKDSGIFVLKSVKPRYKMHIVTRLMDIYEIDYSQITIELIPRVNGKENNEAYNTIVSAINLEEEIIHAFFEKARKQFRVRTLPASIHLDVGKSKLSLISFWNDGNASLKLSVLSRKVEKDNINPSIYDDLILHMNDFLIEKPNLDKKNKYVSIDPVILILNEAKFLRGMENFILKWGL